MAAKIQVIHPPLVVVPSNCTNGDVRLVDGGNEMEGRVEICRGGVWGAITELSWDHPDAEVTCRQLGYPSECECMQLCMSTIL